MTKWMFKDKISLNEGEPEDGTEEPADLLG